MADNLSGLDRTALDKAISNAEVHDNSKMSIEEYKSYDAYFYGNNRSHAVVNAFNLAWLHHIHNNPHHWQHWILVNDDEDAGTIALEMPLEYVYEMIADWWSFSWKNDNLMEIFDWYDKHKGRMILHKKTKEIVERILNAIKEKVKSEEPEAENGEGVENEQSV
jgi:hypothetical protein